MNYVLDEVDRVIPITLLRPTMAMLALRALGCAPVLRLTRILPALAGFIEAMEKDTIGVARPWAPRDS